MLTLLLICTHHEQICAPPPILGFSPGGGEWWGWGAWSLWSAKPSVTTTTTPSPHLPQIKPMPSLLYQGIWHTFKMRINKYSPVQHPPPPLSYVIRIIERWLCSSHDGQSIDKDMSCLNRANYYLTAPQHN